MYANSKILVGMAGDKEVYIEPKMANRHGLIAGATGTGKTVTLKVMAESFSSMGVPVFLADVKGDIAGSCMAGEMSGKVAERVEQYNLAAKGFACDKFPVTFWDIYGDKGTPIRTTISDMGPIILGKVLGLTDIQKDILTVIFKIADDQNLALLDTKDLKSMIQFVADNSDEFKMSYGNMSSQSLAAIIRAVVALEQEGGEIFFGEPALNIKDWIRTDSTGKGMISILDAQTLINHPGMYTAFMLWMMTELFEQLPEVGDLDKPRMVFFFDEAHLLFKDCDKILLEKIEQVVKLIRSKGVGIYFVTQNPRDLSDGVLAQLGNKVQHALHAYTPSELKGVKVAAESFRVNPEFDTFEAIQALGVGEALVSTLDLDGIPSVVEKCTILPPQSKMGPIDDATRASMINQSEFELKYRDSVDNESAYELLAVRVADAQAAAQQQKEEALAAKEAEKEAQKAEKEAEKQALREKAQAQKEAAAAEKAKAREKAKAQSTVKKAVKSTASTTAGTIGRELGKSVGKSVGGNFGKTLGGNVGASIFRGIIGTMLK